MVTRNRDDVTQLTFEERNMRSATTWHKARARGSGSANAKYYERTQHLAENKEEASKKPSKYLEKSNLVELAQHVIDKQASCADERPSEIQESEHEPSKKGSTGARQRFLHDAETL